MKSKKQNKKGSSIKITKDMTFSEVLQKHPELAQEMFELGMHCVGCSAAAFETLEQGALAHGISPAKLMKKLNEKIKITNDISAKKSGKSNSRSTKQSEVKIIGTK